MKVNNDLKDLSIKGKILLNVVPLLLDFIATLQVCILILKEILCWQM